MQGIVGNDAVLLRSRLAGWSILENAFPGGGSRHGGIFGALSVRSDPLIVAEEENLVTLDRTANGAAERVMNQHRKGSARGVAEKIVGVQIPIPYIVEGIAVKLVSAAAGDQLDLGAGAAAVFGLASVGHHAGFFHRIRIIGGLRKSDAGRH